MTPLIFRLYEAVGAPLPTRNLPREYAVADLRGTMGWKAEVEAAERLARSGALSANQLLGLYTERKPAASGGVWDRVRAIQDFDEAMTGDEPEAIAAALPRVWKKMAEVGLDLVFATLYGERLAELSLPGDTQLAHEIVLLSPAYERAAQMAGTQTRRIRLLDGLAQAAPDPALADTPAERAVAAAFGATEIPRDHSGPLAQGRLGQAILSAAGQLDAARPGDTRDLQAALATLRFVGLEDVARRAALQILLLSESG